MESVWVIEEGEYSDYHVVGVYDSRESAETILASLPDYDRPTIAEWPLNPCLDEVRMGLHKWRVVMLIDGTTERADELELSSYRMEPSKHSIWERTKAPFYQGKGVPDALSAEVWASSREHAVKITNEIRIQMIANGEWK